MSGGVELTRLHDYITIYYTDYVITNLITISNTWCTELIILILWENIDLLFQQVMTLVNANIIRQIIEN